ncbi:MAG: hypothetical protein C0478_05400 [Planctomyces sp.]|nr:hypothetical protein [Planctomyces sp.]
MKKFVGLSLLVAMATLAAMNGAYAQAAKNPFNLPNYGAVKKAKSDTRSTQFYNSVMPTFSTFIDKSLKEASQFKTAPEYVLDPTRLYLPLSTLQPVRVYFLHEGAGYRNQLGVAIVDAGHGRNGASVLIDPLSQGKLIFEDASFELTQIKDKKGKVTSESGGLSKGDYVEIGHISAGKQVDFFLPSDGANGTKNLLRNFKELNSDGLQHVIAVYFKDTHPGYVLIGFEDIVGGGDLDYNDTLFVVDFGYDITIDKEDLPH